jgi:hypothetical protein
VYTPLGRRDSKGVASDGDGSDENKLVVQQVKEVGVTLCCSMLMENNYGMWAVKMKIFMRAQGVWAVVVAKAADEKMDQMALATIVQGVQEALVMATISKKETAKEAWTLSRRCTWVKSASRRLEYKFSRGSLMVRIWVNLRKLMSLL